MCGRLFVLAEVMHWESIGRVLQFVMWSITDKAHDVVPDLRIHRCVCTCVITMYSTCTRFITTGTTVHVLLDICMYIRINNM